MRHQSINTVLYNLTDKSASVISSIFFRILGYLLEGKCWNDPKVIVFEKTFKILSNRLSHKMEEIEKLKLSSIAENELD